MGLFPDSVTEQHMDVFMAIADGFLREVDPATIREYVDRDFPQDKIDEYTASVGRPSTIPGFREFIKELIENNTGESIRLFGLTMQALDSRIFAPALTGSTTLVRDMTDEQKEKMLRSWRDSPIQAKQRVFRLMFNLTVSTFQRVAPAIHKQAMGIPDTDLREVLYEGHKPDEFKYTMMQPPASDNVELYLPNIDAVIIGSGSGAGVTAHTLAQAGMKVLVIEKGKYFQRLELNFDDKTGWQELYEGRGQIPSKNSQTMILAGATFGGGSTVNWSACLKTPFKVRKEWYDDFGVDWFATEAYDNDMEYVLKQMGASTEHITHSFSNQTLIDGCEKLGYAAKAVPQNNGSHTNHSCGMCHLGCKWGVKQGSMVNWLRSASENGAQFMDQVMVNRLVRNKKNITTHIECTDVRTGNNFTIKGPRRFIVAAGSLHSPVLLQRSGFRNKHIGKNLKLHPISALTGIFDEHTDPHYNSIMTSVCTAVDDLDGKSHGAKIETLLHTPLLESIFTPWESSNQMRQDILKYQGAACFILLTRDTSLGTVTYDKERPDKLVIEYDVNKYDRNAILQALLVTADVIYIQGGKEIIHPSWQVERFVSHKSKELRSIHDADYQAWRKKVAETPLSAYGTAYGSAHQMSTCRMSGKGPRYGACDARGRTFESDNVYITDASVLPTASGANPMISTMACARHIAQGIADECKPSAKL